MDIQCIEGKYAGRAELLRELREFVSYYIKAKGQRPTRVLIDRRKIRPLFDMAKGAGIQIEPLVYDSIPVELV